ncbi:flagellar motor switch protein FliY [Malaciobacter halophilus]|uniref:Flagellar motor switch protein FliN n=1 Tax=Malaciobacter halophilus TaxID=197482 RepID=A0A2N1IZT6_9BACT|nr:FliM/FliN family flagellar motor switch protein [Malaciobacter halophilus]AXH10486.1 flagellar motor switch C-ring protein FliY [Malaciobacter halophilus]PKI79807.1 flagellar motor switch protein FliY [Malaciobacter halophilus]
MASDLSNILKDELTNTLEQLLSKSASIDNIQELNQEDYESTQCIKVDVKFDFSAGTTNWSFFIPTISATKFEYFMLGGMGDLKEHIDDEIADAVNEITSNICGSFATSVNAQNFADIGSIKFELVGSSIVESSVMQDKQNTYEFSLSMDSEKLPVLISFDDLILPYISSITGKEQDEDIALAPDSAQENAQQTVAKTSNSNLSSEQLGISSLLSENSAHNLQLLFNIKLKLSVRLGTKNFLLKDILRWDIGEIIELDQMVNEPLEILVNGVKIGEGEAVIVEGKFGLKVKSIGNESLRLNQLGLK